MTRTNTISVNGMQLITQEGACVALDCSMSTLRRLVIADRLRRVRVLGRWLIDWSSIQKVIEARK
jgi:hypothetical protein